MGYNVIHPETRNRLPYIGAPPHLPRPMARDAGMVWTKDCQARGVERGFFFQHRWPDHHVCVIPLAGFATDADVVSALESAAFGGDAFARLALDFVAQQDQYGDRGAWGVGNDASHRYYTPSLKWYEHLKARKLDRKALKKA